MILFNSNFILGCCKSWFDITTHVIFCKKKQVIFAAPQHFNRGTNSKNQFLEKLVNLCKSNNVPFLILESPEYEAPQPHDPDSVRADLIFWLMMLLNKIALKIYGTDNEKKARKSVAKVMNCLTLGKLKVDKYITMAGLFIEMFEDMNPTGTVYDLQHGIIYAGHPGYFNAYGGIAKSLSASNCKVLLWGKGYKELFLQTPKIDKNKTLEIGYPIEQKELPKKNTERNTILFSLQFTADIDYKALAYLKGMLDKALSSIDFSKYTIKLKHHPRYNDIIDLSDLYEKYPDAIITTEKFESLIDECLLNLTWYSTTCFEFAAFGVPTFILSDSQFGKGEEIYYSQFKYPVFKGLSLQKVLESLNNPQKAQEVSALVREWYLKLYSPFDYKNAKSVLGIDEKKD